VDFRLAITKKINGKGLSDMEWYDSQLWVILFFFVTGVFLFWHVPRLPKVDSRKSSLDELGVSIIIPARNEAHRIGQLLESIAKQTYRPDEIIVVDDGSTDSTTEISGLNGAFVLEGQPLPAKWTGKNWACWQGALYAKGEILVFLDADVWLEEDGLVKIVHSLTKKNGLITIQPFHITYQAYEQLSAFFNIILMAGLNAFTPFGSKIPPRGGFGPCAACWREHYFKIGGHGAARTAVLESLPFGEAFQKAGFSVQLYGGRGVVNFRMYPKGLRELVEGWTKGFGKGALSLRVSFLVMCVLWVWGCFSTFSLLVQSVFETGWPLVAGLILYSLYALEIQWMLRRIGKFKWWTHWLYPLPLVFFALIMGWSLFKIFIIKKVTWHGREIVQ
jgi:4,4'-diaponeurosporenoate glycosyltransferase